MKIRSVETLRLIRAHTLPAPLPNAPGAGARVVGVPFPIHKYPEFGRTPATTPGEVSGEMWVRVTAENGEWGLGHTHWGDYAAPLVDKFFGPLLVGRDCFAIELLNDLMWRSAQRFGATGVASLARSAIDLALWDLKGKVLAQPVYRLLGGPCRSTLDCYVTAGNLEWARELGFKAFKMRNSAHYDDGIEGINRLEEQVAKARELVGPDADLMLNPVMSFNVEYAIRVMERLRPYRLRWVEEPLMPYDTEGLVRLKQAVPTLPIATGEDHHGRHAFRELVERRCADVLQPDIRWAGGLSEVMKIYTIAEAAGIATIPHGGGGMPAGQHFAAATAESTLVEYVLRSPPGVSLQDANRIPGMPVPRDGKLVVSDAPGFGMEFLPEDFAPWSV
ncbi:enolase C-terminal domain-like protein [Peristeroidobacter soli]|uniref:enolase C-terminal domain-like protein n=1 Tax=Peristeroidobacter soli TaxID=2497877 RepID=UPI00158A0152|nr:enolase C-terminal domain-like protein [Peristeroidobacter soli]